MTILAVAAVLMLAGGLALFTGIAGWLIERSNPPKGRFVDVPGGRMHVADIGAAADAVPVVLLHGASGNLEDMRLALGERLAAATRVILIDRPGHGWSERSGGDADAAPARQAELVRDVLDRLGVTRAVIVGHSWSGALATAFALAYPDRTAGLVVLGGATHPWQTGIAWPYRLSTTPVVGELFARTLMVPLGFMLIGRGTQEVFAPQAPPQDYLTRASGRLLLRPTEYLANARDVADLLRHVTLQAPRYSTITAPTVIITGELDTTVSPQIHTRALAAAVPNAKLIMLPDVGHMPHHAAPDVVAGEIKRLAGASPQVVEKPR